MPRLARLDAPGVLNHVMGRGIDGIKIFGDKKDCEDFLERLADLCGEKALRVYAWALMGNHYHSLLRTGNQRLSTSMWNLLKGYVVNYSLKPKMDYSDADIASFLGITASTVNRLAVSDELPEVGK